MVPRDGGLGLPGEQRPSQWPQPDTLEPEWSSLRGCPCSRDFLKPSRGCFKCKHCKALPGLPLASREKTKNTLESYSGLARFSSGKFHLNCFQLAGLREVRPSCRWLCSTDGRTDGRLRRSLCLPRGQGWVWQRLQWGGRKPEPRGAQRWMQPSNGGAAAAAVTAPRPGMNSASSPGAQGCLSTLSPSPRRSHCPRCSGRDAGCGGWRG